MKQSLLVALCLVFSLNSFANQKADEAAAAYAQRDFDEAGVKNALQAVDLYKEAVVAETDAVTKLNLQLDLASAHYFLGTAMDQKNDRKAQHQNAMDVADEVMIAMGVQPDDASEMSQQQVTALLNKLTDDEELILADAMYSKGINLAQWGNLNGIASSIGKLPIVLGLMERIDMLGYSSIHEYGPYRTIGRINFKLPKLLGGDLDKSEKYLKDAYRLTLVEGQRYSVNGYNNIYLAETLYKLGKETQAIKLIDLFLAADPSTLKVNNEPENNEALRVAQELADNWK